MFKYDLLKKINSGKYIKYKLKFWLDVNKPYQSSNKNNLVSVFKFQVSNKIEKNNWKKVLSQKTLNNVS